MLTQIEKHAFFYNLLRVEDHVPGDAIVHIGQVGSRKTRIASVPLDGQWHTIGVVQAGFSEYIVDARHYQGRIRNTHQKKEEAQ